MKVPFTQSFLGREEHGLDDKLVSETEGILAWLVQGYSAYARNGLKPLPASVRTATAEYREEQNTTRRFFDERLRKETESDAQKSAVISAYSSWCSSNKVRQLSNKGFGNELRRWYGTGLQDTRIVYKGVKLL